MNTGKLVNVSKEISYDDVKASLGAMIVSDKFYKKMVACHEDETDYPVRIPFEDIHLLFTAWHKSLPGGYFTISYEIIEGWEINVESLYMDALQIMSEREPAECELLENIVKEILDVDKQDEQTDATNDINKPLVLYTQKQNGAAAVFYPDQLKKIAKKYQCSLYIAFTSQHEAILHQTIGKNEILERRILKSLSRVPCTFEEKVSDSVYYYDLETDTLTKC